jgi:hypothetical protein
MSSGGGSPPNAGEGAGETPNPNQRRKKKKNRVNRESKFEGKCSDLKSSVYDVVSGKDTFAKTTREIAEYVGREFDDAGEFRTGMVDMQLRPLDEPAPPADPNQVVEFELWKMARQNCEKQAEARRRNSSRVYALIIGQCSQAL